MSGMEMFPHHVQSPLVTLVALDGEDEAYVLLPECVGMHTGMEP